MLDVFGFYLLRNRGVFPFDPHLRHFGTPVNDQLTDIIPMPCEGILLQQGSDTGRYDRPYQNDELLRSNPQGISGPDL